jgi:predicted heme/steroid binding protein
MKVWLLLATFTSLFVLAACGGSAPAELDPINEEDLIEFTLETLAEFDGRDGRMAYIAVDGKVYDVTGSPRWRNGNHNGYQAGQDLTNVIDEVSPHGRGVLARMRQVGTLVDE